MRSRVGLRGRVSGLDGCFRLPLQSTSAGLGVHDVGRPKSRSSCRAHQQRQQRQQPRFARSLPWVVRKRLSSRTNFFTVCFVVLVDMARSLAIVYGLHHLETVPNRRADQQTS